MTDDKKPRVAPPLIVAALVTATVGVGALVVPKKYVATFVGLVFLGAVWRLVWTKDDESVREHGVQLGGLLLHEPVVIPNVLREGARAAGWALACAILIFGPYYLGWRYWWHPHHAFSLDFKPLEIAFLITATILAGLVASNGNANWIEGVQLLAIYLMACFVFWYL